ncbi:hypothetical protein ASE95_02395 [Sphingomonas sp. Leaf231]|uniref:hypothetical protein n=1 Tax=Sphingomonas sp. Leaf231 TaxID=1736301 RepID=UPI0006F9DF8E|nr:hypothetical protein [Sphingomonas sp. Leaf231]KQN93786.1 hypothetical protein ASE95_02395 [Sphingomonas sp. Leaf231]
MAQPSTISLFLLAIAATPVAAQSGPPAPGMPRVARTTAAEGMSRSAPVNGVIVLYGNERCPTNSDGAEVVVCTRRPAEEQFRIPKELRNFEITPENENWAARVQANNDVGAVGVGSCSTVGAASATGCVTQNATRWKKERRAAAKRDTPDLP